MGPRHYRPDLHEAKDLAGALARLDRAGRVRWLRLCCLKYSLGQAGRVDVVASSGEVRDVLVDFHSICGQNGLTPEWAQGLAEHLGRGRAVRDFFER